MGHKSLQGFFGEQELQYSWILLPGSIWLQMPINQLYLAAFEVLEHISVLWKHVDNLLVYQSFTMPLHHQALPYNNMRTMFVLSKTLCMFHLPVRLLGVNDPCLS